MLLKTTALYILFFFSFDAFSAHGPCDLNLEPLDACNECSLKGYNSKILKKIERAARLGKFNLLYESTTNPTGNNLKFSTRLKIRSSQVSAYITRVTMAIDGTDVVMMDNIEGSTESDSLALATTMLANTLVVNPYCHL